MIYYMCKSVEGNRSRNQERQVKEMEENKEMSLSDKAIQRLKEYLLSKGWTKDEIFDLIDYITK